MHTRILAASLLSLGLLAAPAAFAGESNGYNCSKDDNQRADYADCYKGDGSAGTTTYGAAVVEAAPKGRVGDFINETVEEKNDRSGSNGNQIN
jgi:hypothetical protein